QGGRGVGAPRRGQARRTARAARSLSQSLPGLLGRRVGSRRAVANAQAGSCPGKFRSCFRSRTGQGVDTARPPANPARGTSPPRLSQAAVGCRHLAVASIGLALTTVAQPWGTASKPPGKRLPKRKILEGPFSGRTGGGWDGAGAVGQAPAKARSATTKPAPCKRGSAAPRRGLTTDRTSAQAAGG